MLDVVTGGAGFIGSTLTDHLLASGRRVRVVDSFEPWYPKRQKQANLAEALIDPSFDLVCANLLTEPLEPLLRDADVVYHLAGQAGVQSSWAEGFGSHCRNNILATQQLFEACLSAGVRRVVLASSSSVYGRVDGYSHESDPVAPISPYATSKLAAEHLADVYRLRGLDIVTLRYFTVFGPRQRPDMAMHKLINAALTGASFPLYGSGQQRRSFTYVGDVVAATARAGAIEAVSGLTINVGGGAPVPLREVIGTVEKLTGTSIIRECLDRPPGDPDLTAAAIERANDLLGWRPATSVEDGLHKQVAWHRQRFCDPSMVEPSSSPASR